MPRLGPIARRELIANLRRLGFDGPFPGGRHEFMTRGSQHVTLPNPHPGDVSRGFLVEILRQSGVSRDAWEAL